MKRKCAICRFPVVDGQETATLASGHRVHLVCAARLKREITRREASTTEACNGTRPRR